MPQERAIHLDLNGWFCWDPPLREADALLGRDLSCLRRELHLFFLFMK